MAEQSSKPTRRPAPAASSNRRSDKEVEDAASQLGRAAALCGLINGEHLTCPWCGTDKAKKVKLVADKKYIKCYRCGEYSGAIKLVQSILGVNFPAAVDLLNGRDPRGSSAESDEHRSRRLAEASARADMLSRNSFSAELTSKTVALYNAVLASPHSSLEAAQKYYGTWHISPDAVATIGFVVITDVTALAKSLVDVFGEDLVIASGLGKKLEPGERDTEGLGLRFMFSKNYPVVEPQIGPAGNCMSMQFRPSLAQKAKVTAHKLGKGDYVPPFMSLRGAGEEHLIGIGLDHLVAIPPTRVDIVEGAKDVAADLTLGNEAFGMPGTGVLPPAKSVRALAKAGHRLRICMDGDDAGRASQQKVYDHLIKNGFPPDRITIHQMPEGMDVTDVLVSKVAESGDGCAVCVKWRSDHPAQQN